MISLSALQAMPRDQQWKLVDGWAANSVRAPSIKTCKPDWIGPLYTNTPMPHYIHGKTSIQLDEDNVYNGKLKTSTVTMLWKGYACQLYDGELKMCPIAATAESYIAGDCNGIAFMFKETDLEYGVWPGFLLLYKK
jgi:hypothetical protein